MKLIVQIPCHNEEKTLSSVINSIPKKIDGIDIIETMIIDDGSTDKTSDVAKKLGVNHILVNNVNKGLAYSFHRGMNECVKLNADIIVNTDGDNQYCSKDISLLVKPIINDNVDIVIGDRGGMKNEHFSFFKRILQVFGSKVISKITKVNVNDAVSGFRAISREAAKSINIVSEFSYTIEMLVQASSKKLKVTSVPIRTNTKTRESRLFKNIPQFLFFSVTTLLRMYTMYKPLKVYTTLGLLSIVVGLIPVFRFLYFYFTSTGEGHIQSLILGTTLLNLGVFTLLIGLLADLVSFNRKLIEKLMEKSDER